MAPGTATVGRGDRARDQLGGARRQWRLRGGRGTRRRLRHSLCPHRLNLSFAMAWQRDYLYVAATVAGQSPQLRSSFPFSRLQGICHLRRKRRGRSLQSAPSPLWVEERLRETGIPPGHLKGQVRGSEGKGDTSRLVGSRARCVEMDGSAS